MSNILALSAVAAMANNPEPWVNDPFDAVVKNSQHPQPANGPKKAKPSKCVLVDPNDPNSILAASWFGGNFTHFEDKIIRVGGRGNKVTQYNGKAELSVGKDATVTVMGAAPAQMGPGAAPASAPTAASAPPASARPNVDPVTYFHREMKKTALLWTHSFQYALNVNAKMAKPLDAALFQSLVSSLFITAKDVGLREKPPAPRELDEHGIPFAFVPPTPDPKAAEEAARKAAEAARIKAEEDAKRAAEEARANHEQNLDEDVPF